MRFFYTVIRFFIFYPHSCMAFPETGITAPIEYALIVF